MKICFVIDRYPPRPHSSIGSFVQKMARGLHARGHQVNVVELGDSHKEWDDSGVRVMTLRRSNVPYVGNLISRLRLRGWLHSRVMSGAVELIEAPDYMGFLPFGVGGCVTVVRLHLSDTAVRRCCGKRLARGIYYYERRNLIANRDWIAVSRHILELTESVFGVSPARSAVIYNALLPAATVQPKAMELPSRFVLNAGEVRPHKGVLVLAEAASEFLKQKPDVHLVFVGSVYEENGRPVSKDILDIVGPELSERVHILGRVDRETVLECMRRASVFAFPSRLEAFGFVLVEAMSCGLPVVCTNYPPGPELVEDGVTGLLADPLSPNDFSKKIICLLDNAELANRLAANARRLVAERFSFQRCMQETERFYEDCLRH